MKKKSLLLAIISGVLCAVIFCFSLVAAAEKTKILVVSSYHKGYLWTDETNSGFCDAMLKLGYFDNKEQITEFSEKDSIETSKIILKKTWMDTNRNKANDFKIKRAGEVVAEARAFAPDFIFLGDDAAAEYVGSIYLDTEIPVVFWGLNNTPVKYGLLDSIQKPGHNITGVYQSGYFKESIELLLRMFPDIKTFAILSDLSVTGRTNAKAIKSLARRNQLPLKLVETYQAEYAEQWKAKALELQDKVDAFYVTHYGGLKNDSGGHASPKKMANWFIENIKIPEATQGIFVKKHELLCGTYDSGYSQAFEAVFMAHEILANGKKPTTMAARTPERGTFMVNKKRADILGIKIIDEMGVEEIIQ